MMWLSGFFAGVVAGMVLLIVIALIAVAKDEKDEKKRMWDDESR